MFSVQIIMGPSYYGPSKKHYASWAVIETDIQVDKDDSLARRYLMSKEKAQELHQHLLRKYPKSQMENWETINLLRHSSFQPYPPMSIEDSVKVIHTADDEDSYP